ncbi:bifunctional murein DD-endopeptidase/murein LD-carboxypeptidase [Candidatus Palibaumannia cicadellinicola]|uniref:Bifunctional murein DD-endopeptidase/murein LD-carboxypeptidase n=1 Tax=Candidatus Palibaumannia cicadellinicola TaxID=186490 RepID=A0A2N4XW83_9GAMM|nr:bifunctional murein DD-endopeptidase/murein LD-carboxypeptidase [Candidatus Baumannia cicadellinicola]PLK58218.1 bifunctional murein DD-endopeptidase/murein LD-carboxypeptidase [Candidatus Baumannia cicadellinicola]
MRKYQYIFISMLQVIFTIAIAVFCSGYSNYYHSKRTMNAVSNSTNWFLQASQNQFTFEEMISHLQIKSKILNQYAKWKGVRYRLGGISKEGIDCSAFVQKTFRDQFSLKLPRSTINQKNLGSKIYRTHLLPGDLVLFNVNSRLTGSHIGIYLGNDLFVHASTSSGVMISNLNDGYWKACYYEARRILKNIAL